MNPIIEVNIMVALLRAATEQTRMLNGHFRHEKKHSFNNMQRAMEHWLALMEIRNKNSPQDEIFFDNLTDAIHEVCDYLRDEMDLVIKETQKLNEKGQDSTASDQKV